MPSKNDFILTASPETETKADLPQSTDGTSALDASTLRPGGDAVSSEKEPVFGREGETGQPPLLPRRHKPLRSKSLMRRSTEADRRGRFRSSNPPAAETLPSFQPRLPSHLSPFPGLPLPPRQERSPMFLPPVWQNNKGDELALLIRENIRLSNELVKSRTSKDASTLERNLRQAITLGLNYAYTGKARKGPYNRHTPNQPLSGEDEQSAYEEPPPNSGSHSKGCPHCRQPDARQERDYFVSRLKALKPGNN
eukprot:Gregarina_sp_Poly_1__2247@NODE_15_length_23029_cov_81_474305_g13_i0_p12_GENE_NODE_15_length_23029_cov_81_474305_g13_i0NODE_15_length_23029_cov_81_474305_g13_i0_p12_ORF_typecomplete_len252_score41_96_NODE_15_length_23029_cov_81_474305_g13_i01355014305